MSGPVFREVGNGESERQREASWLFNDFLKILVPVVLEAWLAAYHLVPGDISEDLYSILFLLKLA